MALAMNPSSTSSLMRYAHVMLFGDIVVPCGSLLSDNMASGSVHGVRSICRKHTQA